LTQETKDIIRSQGAKLEQIEGDYKRFEKISSEKNAELSREMTKVSLDSKIHCFFTAEDPLFDICEP